VLLVLSADHAEKNDSFTLMNRSARILIVEDQYFVAVDSEMHLRSAGFECVGLAATSEQAVQLASELKPDLVLMDIRLAGEGDGVQAAIDIYRDCGIRSIFTSGHADNVVREQACRAEPLGWLSKPYSNSELLRAVSEGLSQMETAEVGIAENSPSRDARAATIQ
jgi:two-component system, response regulator PdtaR